MTEFDPGRTESPAQTTEAEPPVRQPGDKAQPDPGRLWLDVLDCIRPGVSREGFETWLAPTTGVGYSNGSLVVEVPNSFFPDWIGQHYAPAIEVVLARLAGRPLQLNFRTTAAKQVAGYRLLAAERTRDSAVRGAKAGVGRLQAHYTFANFVIGETSRLAGAAARSVAERPGRAYNPLFIYGPTGLGKTHLLQAIGNYALSVNRGLSVHYVPAETLFVELIQAIERNTRLEFKNRYRALDILLLDDIHYLVGKERLQEEVFHIFNHLHDSGSQVVFTSDRPAREIPTLEERLITRLSSGLVVDIQAPDLETRIAILKSKAAQERTDLPDDIAAAVAERVKTSVRELEGSLHRLLAIHSLTGGPLTLELVDKALAGLVRPGRPLDEHVLIRRVCDEYRVTVQDIKGAGRTKQLAFARQVTMYLLRTRLRLSLKEVGRALGDKDHTTVMHAVEKVTRLRSQDPGFAQRLDKLAATTV